MSDASNCSVLLWGDKWIQHKHDTTMNDWQVTSHSFSAFSFNKQQVPSCTHHKHPTTLTACWPLFHSQPHIGSSRHLEARLPQFAMWNCACEWSSPSGYVKHPQSLLVAVDTRRHPVNAQRSLEINPVCMSILTKHTNRHAPSCMRAPHAHTHMRMHNVINMVPTHGQDPEA